MTDEEVIAFNTGVIEQFRANAGVMPEDSPFHGNPTLLLTMTGAKSGRELTTPLTYTKDPGADRESDGDGFIIMASAGGDPKAPAWTFNLRANPNVTIEVLGETIPVRAVETEGDERRRVFELMVTNLPRFGGYQESVERVIPVFRLDRIEP